MTERDDFESVNHGELLGAWVRQRRAGLGITAEQVAERMGLSIPGNYVTQLENGGRKRMISQPRLGQLARALNATEEELLRAAQLLVEESDGKAEQADLTLAVVMANARDLTPEGLTVLSGILESLKRTYPTFFQR